MTALATNPDIYIDNLQITSGAASVDGWALYQQSKPTGNLLMCSGKRRG
ncbi:MAG: hypothetical protein RLY93_01570 [Sumerlaeia bacterium]